MRKILKTALVVGAVAATSGTAFAGIIIQGAVPTPARLLDSLLALFGR